MPRTLTRYRLGEHFTEEDYHKWKKQLEWWVEREMPNIPDPINHVEKIFLAAMNGTKLNGEAWPGISDDFFKRIKQLSQFDLKLGIGYSKQPKSRSHHVTKDSGKAIKEDDLPPINYEQAVRDQEEYRDSLIEKYPHLVNPVYKPKVDELSETVIKSRMLSQEFMFAKGTKLERLSKIRESLHKQIGELMDFLEISPKFLVKKQKDAEAADVGSLIAKLESYGEVWKDYERLDALRELLQRYHQLNSTRPDGTPQLNDWELWHQTRTKPMHFTCRKCGEKYELLDGFTPEEIEEALLQAYKIYGFGLAPIDDTEEEALTDMSELEMIDDAVPDHD
jgi:hypothetical protein